MAESVEELILKARAATTQGQFAAAEALCGEIVALRPAEPVVPLLRAIGAAQSGRLPQSADLFEEALRLNADSTEAMNWLSAVYRHCGRIPESIAMAERVLDKNRNDIEALFNLGLGFLDTGHFEPAAKAFGTLIQLQPNLHPAHYHLGMALLRTGRDRHAVGALESAIRLEPRAAQYHLSLGMAKMGAQDLPGARRAVDQALRLQPDFAPALVFRAKLHLAISQRHEAEKDLRRAMAIDPQFDQAQSELAYILHATGRFDEARSLSRRSLELNPNQGTAYYSLVQTQRCTEDDRELLGRMTELATAGALPTTELLFLRYGLGKAYDDLGEFEVAMQHFDAANRIRYDLSAAEGEWQTGAFTEFADKAISTFSSEFFSDLDGFGSDSELPLFIVGMIRSGTTLLENVLSCHPGVFAGGELQFWPNMGLQVIPKASGEFNRKAVKDAAEQYCQSLRRIGPRAERVTDKMPGNYAYLGLIHLHLPNARIVHVRRNPLDTVLSIWTTYVGSMGFRNRREDIVFAYRLYQRFMRHWRAVLPPDRFLEIDYEDLVGSPESTVLKVLEFCGLEWSEACLHPESSTRFVETPSMWRVRQPVDTSSVDRWRRYEPWLGEFSRLFDEEI